MAGTETKQTAHADNRTPNKFVRVLNDSTNRHVVAIIVNGKVHVFEGNERQAMVRCPGPPTALELERREDSASWCLWVSTQIGQRGRVYRKTLPPSSSSLSSKSSPPPSDLHPTHQMMETESGDSPSSVYDDLLSDIDREQRQSKGKDFTHSDPKVSRVPGDAVCDISDKDRALTCQGEVIGISVTKDFLSVLCCEDSQKLVVTIFSVDSSLQQQTPTMKTLLRIPVPACALVPGKKTAQHVPKLMTVVSDSENQSGSKGEWLSSSSLLRIPPHVFSVLFGKTSTVQRWLAVVVCCLPDGSVYGHPVAPHLPAPCWRLMCVLNGPVLDILSMQVNRQLTDQEQVAAELHSAMGLSVCTPSHSLLDACVAVGASGRCCLLVALPTLGADHQGTRDSEGQCCRVTTTFTLPGTALSCLCGLLSSGLYVGRHPQSQVDRCELTVVRQGSDRPVNRSGGEESSDRRGYVVQVDTSPIFTASVSAMWLSGSEDGLVCQTVNGDLIEVDGKPPTADHQGHCSLGAGPQPSLKELLLGVDVSQTRLDQLKKVQAQHNAFLQQMNLAARLLHQGKSEHPIGHPSQAPVSCEVRVQSVVGYSQVSFQLLVELTNHSAVSLTKDWSLVIALREVTGRPDVGQKEGEDRGENKSSFNPCSSNTGLGPQHHHEQTEQQIQADLETDQALPSTRTFPLTQGLGPQGQAEFLVPLTYSSTSCGLKVEVSLVLQFPEHLESEACGLGPDSSSTSSSSSSCSCSCLFVPLAGSFVDVFHFLRLRQPGVTLPPVTVLDPCSMVHRKVAELNGCGSCDKLRAESAKPSASGQIYTISEVISVPAERGLATPVSVARGLLKDTAGPVGEGQRMSQPCCSLQAPCGSSLSLSVEPVTVAPCGVTSSSLSPNVVSCGPGGGGDGDGGGGGGRVQDMAYRVVMKSSNISLLARARLSLTRRLQALGNTPRDTGVEEFRRIVQKTDALLQQLQARHKTQGEGGTGKMEDRRGLLSELCALYEKAHSDSA